jgi:hypothetical protein
MGHRRAIPEVVHWIIIQLGTTTMTKEDIAMYTDVSVCSVRKILTYFWDTGGVNFAQKQIAPPQLHKSLCDYDVEVCTTFIHHC